MPDQTDAMLMECYVAGDTAAFDELFNRYQQHAFAYFMRRTRSEERSSDLYQELFLRIHRFRDTYDRKRPFAPWFYRIAHNVLIDDFRCAARNQEVFVELDCIPSPEPNAEQQLDQRLRVKQILSIISDEQRAVLVAAKVEGLDYVEIAARVGKTVDAVKQGASRALRRLRAADGPSA